MSEIEQKALADLARSGIKVAPHLGLHVTDDASLEHPELPPVAGLVIQYFDETGAPLVDEDGFPFKRIRVYEDAPPSPVPGLKPKKRPKYLQAKGTGVHPYLPPTLDWQRIFSDPSVPIIITEGEKKALAAAQEGFACIALGGVHSFMQDGNFLPLLSKCEWRNRVVWIAFDSDAAVNAMIRDAETKLLTQLSTVRHADVRLVRFPSVPGGVGANGRKLPDVKVGLDDYLVAHGVEALYKLLVDAPTLSKIDKEVLRLNEEVAWIRTEGKVYVLDKNIFLSKSDFTNGDDFSSRKVERIGHGKKGPHPLPPLSVAEEWLKHPNRRGYADIVFRPGEPQVTFTEHGDAWNTWGGLNSQPGDASLFEEATAHVFSEVEAELRDFPLKLMAFKAQNPGAKPPIALLLVGNEGGGKGMWASMIASAFAPYSMSMHAGALVEEYNQFVERNLIVVVQEAEGEIMRKVGPKLRHLVADSETSLRAMYRIGRQVQSKTMYILTANDRAAGSFGKDDRRYFVAQTPNLDESRGDWYRRCYEFARERGPVIMHYLLNYDLKGWTPPVKAPVTTEKAISRNEGLTPITKIAELMQKANTPHIIYGWVDNAINYAEKTLAAPPSGLSPAMHKQLTMIKHTLPLMEIRPVYTAEELCLIFPYLAEELAGYAGKDMRSLTPAQLSRALRNAGIATLRSADDPVGGFWRNNKQEHYLIVANVDDECWKRPWTQKEFADMIAGSSKYCEIAAAMRGKK